MKDKTMLIMMENQDYKLKSISGTLQAQLNIIKECIIEHEHKGQIPPNLLDRLEKC